MSNSGQYPAPTGGATQSSLVAPRDHMGLPALVVLAVLAGVGSLLTSGDLHAYFFGVNTALVAVLAGNLTVRFVNRSRA